MVVYEVKTPVSGSVWMRSVAVGEKVFADGQLLLMECMKMEIPVMSPVDGIVLWLAEPGDVVDQYAVVARVQTSGGI